MKYILETPVSSLSLGQVGFNLLRAAYKANHSVAFIPIGNADFSAFEVDQNFGKWLQEAANKKWDFLSKDVPVIKNWHLAESDKVRSSKQILLTYHETNEPTKAELAIANLQHKTLFCGGFSEEVFKKGGAENAGSFNLGFDSDLVWNHKIVRAAKKSFFLGGKFESRKFTKRILNLWAKKYGNQKDYSLNCLIFNPFFSPEDNSRLINDALEGKRYWNINLIPRLKTNKEVSALLASVDVDLSAFGGESWGVDSFNMTCLGKWSVANLSWGQKAWATEDNSVAIYSRKLRPAPDGAFFHPTGDFNQGYFPELDDEEIVDGIERAEQKIGTINNSGLTLGRKMTYDKTLEQILQHV